MHLLTQGSLTTRLKRYRHHHHHRRHHQPGNKVCSRTRPIDTPEGQQHRKPNFIASVSERPIHDHTSENGIHVRLRIRKRTQDGATNTSTATSHPSPGNIRLTSWTSRIRERGIWGADAWRVPCTCRCSEWRAFAIFGAFEGGGEWCSAGAAAAGGRERDEHAGHTDNAIASTRWRTCCCKHCPTSASAAYRQPEWPTTAARSACVRTSTRETEAKTQAEQRVRLGCTTEAITARVYQLPPPADQG